MNTDYEEMKASLEEYQEKLVGLGQPELTADLEKELSAMKKRVEYSAKLEAAYIAELKAARGQGIPAYRRIREKYAAKGLPVNDIRLKED